MAPSRFKPRPPGAPPILPQTHNKCARIGCTSHANKPFRFCYRDGMRLPSEMSRRVNQLASDVSFGRAKSELLEEYVALCQRYLADNPPPTR